MANSVLARLGRPGPALAIIAVLALAAALAGVFTLPVLDRDEARFAQATAQMLQTGDIVEINFLDEPRHKKPAGIHWLQAAAVAITSSETAREIWAYRLPSVLGALLAAIAAYLAGACLIGRRAGFAAGALLAVTVLLGSEAGIAKTDAFLCATAAWAFFGIAGLRTASGRREARIFALSVWVAMGIGVLIKGPVTPMAAGLCVLALIALERRIDWAWPLAWWPAPLIGAGLTLPWLIAVQLATDGAFLQEAVGQDLGPKLVSGHESHDGPPGYHLALLPVLFLPAIAFLPAGLSAAVQRLRRGGAAAVGVKIALAFALPTWLVFELLPTKLPHYVLPAYPALAVIAGLGLARLKTAPAIWLQLGALLLIVGAAFAGPAVLVFLHLSAETPFGPVAAACIAVMLFAFAAAFAVITRRATLALALCVLTGLTWHAGARGVVAPAAGELFVSVRAAQAAMEVQTAAPGADIVSTFTEPSLVFTLGGRVILTDPQALISVPVDPALPRAYIIDESRWLSPELGPLSDEDRTARMDWLSSLTEAACASAAATGINYSRGDDTIVVAVYVTGCPETLEESEDEPQD
ncbi:MAG: glycosyltransferase family 39 protein [Alphaproteobacteria bacterium]|nr:glycosyltransferase family 39 protein [Alphaproteobacteria bacterium]